MLRVRYRMTSLLLYTFTSTVPSSTIKSRCGKLASPLWLPAYEPPTPPTNTFSWTLEPPPIGYNPGIMFDVLVVAAGDTDCSDVNKNNQVTFRSGPGSNPVFSETICLSDLSGSLTYSGSSIVVEFETVDMDMYGFVMDFTAGKLDSFSIEISLMTFE